MSADKSILERLQERQSNAQKGKLDHTRKGNAEMSAGAKHVIETGHEIHWRPKILKKESKMRKRKVHEALTIHTLTRKNKENLMHLDNGMELSSLWLN